MCVKKYYTGQDLRDSCKKFVQASGKNLPFFFSLCSLLSVKMYEVILYAVDTRRTEIFGKFTSRF